MKYGKTGASELKIAMVVERFPPDIGGSGVRYCNIAERLCQKHAIDVFTLGSRSDEASDAGFRTYRFDSARLPITQMHGLERVIGLTFSALFQLPFRSYDIIDVDIWPILPSFSARIAKPHTPIIISWNVVWPFSFQKAISKTSTALARVSSKLNTHNITVSDFAKTILLKHMRINPERISVIPNGNDPAFLRARLKPKPGRIIFAGRLEPQKRLDLILKAFKIFRRKVGDAELHVVGSGSIREQLKHLSGRIDGFYLHDSIPPGNREKLVSILSNSWVFVSASEFETYGMSIAEALSLGLPVVLTRAPYNGAIDDIARNGYNSLIVEHNNPDAIAHALEELYRSPDMWEQLSHNAKRSAPLYSWDDVAMNVEAVYNKVLSTRL